MSHTLKMDEFLVPDIIQDLELVEEEISTNLSSDTVLLEQIASHLISAGGKRVRPALVLLSYRAAGGTNIRDVIPIAAALELIHTASLIHDDINDESMYRRGMISTNRKYGEHNALIGGDFLFIKAFRLGGQYDWEIVKIIADACSQLTEGEIRQYDSRYKIGLTIEEYLQIINKKTASLITGCARAGALISKAPPEYVDALTNFANNIGMAFQITDDLLDVLGDPGKTGKPRGNDIREGQLSIITIRALEKLSGKEMERLETIIKAVENADDEIEQAITIISSTDAADHARSIAQEYGEKALDSLKSLPESDYRDNLELIGEMILERSY